MYKPPCRCDCSLIAVQAWPCFKPTLVQTQTLPVTICLFSGWSTILCISLKCERDFLKINENVPILHKQLSCSSAFAEITSSLCCLIRPNQTHPINQRLRATVLLVHKRHFLWNKKKTLYKPHFKHVVYLGENYFSKNHYLMKHYLLFFWTFHLTQI